MSIEERVKKIIVEQLGVKEEDVKPEASFVEDLGADSKQKKPAELSRFQSVPFSTNRFTIGVTNSSPSPPSI